MSNAREPGESLEVIEGLPAQLRLGLPGVCVVTGLLMAMSGAGTLAPKPTRADTMLIALGIALGALGLAILAFRFFRAVTAPAAAKGRLVLDHSNATATFTGFRCERQDFFHLGWGTIVGRAHTIPIADIRAVYIAEFRDRANLDCLTVVTDSHRFVAAGREGHPQIRRAHDRLVAVAPASDSVTADWRSSGLMQTLGVFGVVVLFLSLVAISWRPLSRFFGW